MRNGILEILGLFLAVVGCITLVGAAALVSVALAVLTAGAFILLAGILLVYAATALERTTVTPKPGERT